MDRRKQKLCVFGCYSDSGLYPRNRELISSLSALFEDTVEVRPANRAGGNQDTPSSSTPVRIIRTAWKAASGFFSLYRQRHRLRGANIYFVPYPAYIDLFFLRLLAPRHGRGKIVIDGFLCLYDTVVHDRKLLKHNSIPARAVRWLEHTTLAKADQIFIDTAQQKRLLVESYGIDEKKITVTPVGIDERIWTALPPLPDANPLRVLFWGTFIPLHGVETIVSAARLLAQHDAPVDITLVGDGQTADAIASDLDRQPLNNLQWQRQLVSPEKLREKVAHAHCILGIFGLSDKAGNVIPYKAYQAMASNRILITQDSPALREVLGDIETIPGLRLVPAGSAEQLAEAILEVQNDYARIGMAPATRDAYQTKLSNALMHAAMQDALASLEATEDNNPAGSTGAQ